ncbi:hypothetical protein PHLCEN_2v3125 [Hermanssonia centrifuga]|uniref:Uncharacterized protein n=1 Tax=Hermanssonia centrifuga TaxID=98765 RepID=A0A2R6R3Z3_9APHY|nr:hypothetical protein PHLCEN_2v3125 [Hermanssonia centrifuga]
MAETSTAVLDKKRDKYRAQLDAALKDDEDPLAAYGQFIKWTIDHYPGDLIAQSGLLELLEEATRQFKSDPQYKGDLRYLKLWSLYASYVETPTTIYKFLLANDIGTVYAQLYEEYASALEKGGRRADAEKIFLNGIKRRARPIERLKKNYAEFQSRASNPLPRTRPNTLSWKDVSPAVHALRKDPLKNYSKPTKSTSSPAEASGSNTFKAPSSSSSSMSHLKVNPKTLHDRYAPMLAPAAPGKRPEKLCFNLSLLFTEDGTEYSAQEVRARSMGLLGKKWAPPPPSELTRNVRVSFNDDGSKDSRNTTRRGLNVGFSEPTVTLATKEALADVFGMYNSPEKSMRFGTVAGSKHAPVRRIEPIAPLSLQAAFRAVAKDNGPDESKTPTAFRPYVDENANRKENADRAPPPRFQIFQDDEPDAAIKPTSHTPEPSRRALSAKEPLASFPPSKSNENAAAPSLKSSTSVPKRVPEERKVLSRVFTPASDKALFKQDVFSDDQHGDSGAKLRPFADPQPPAPVFKVFSRPPVQAESAPPPPLRLEQGAAFTPFVDEGLSSSRNENVVPPSRPILGDRTPLQSFSTPSTSTDEDLPVSEQFRHEPEVGEEYYDTSTDQSSDIDDQPDMASHVPLPEDEGIYEENSMYDDDDGQPHQVPLGGRFGQFNVMTPITERTLEWTSTRDIGMPNDGHPTGKAFLDQDALESAEQLAAELREPETDDEDEDAVFQVEERTGTLSLSDVLAAASSFNPPNPCNPFEGSIISKLLSFIPSDTAFHDLRNQESNQLDVLQKFAKKKVRRASGSSSRGGQDDEALQIELSGRPYSVLDKLGEGGFGAVFEAIDVGALLQKRKGRAGNDDEEELSDEDEDDIPKVALKIVKPRGLWEFHVLRRIHTTFPPHLKRSIITPETLYAYRDESFLVLELCKQGTLLDIVNRAPQAGITQQGACLDELLVMFFAIELMRLLEGMHNAGFIHGDVKIDNCLLRLEDVPGPASAWSSVYQPSGEGGWSFKGIKMIDFGRTIETRLFPVGQRFVGDWPTDARDCLEMREGKAWTYQTDYFGLAGIIYCMLYGKYIEASSVTEVSTSGDSPTRYKLATPFKRYWQGDLWTRLFDVLLNPTLIRADGQLPLTVELEALRVEMETWLQANCNRASNSLKGLLKKISLSLLGGKDGR